MDSAHYEVLFVGLMFRKNDATQSRGWRRHRTFLAPKATSRIHGFNDEARRGKPRERQPQTLSPAWRMRVKTP
jgi:hypothetical protein